MAIVKTENLRKIYRVADKAPGFAGTLKHFLHRQTKDVVAVKDCSFEIDSGEIVGFLGPNGAGKTTTLKMLTGLIHPTEGLAEVAGFTPFDRRAEFLSKITLVMGNKQQLIWDLPTLDSLRINAAVYGVSTQEANTRIKKLSQMLEISDKLKQPVRKLSLGERMKAELLAALLHSPKVLFLDEPTLGMDVNAQVAVRSFLKEYNQENEATILLTSHYLADITALAKRVLVIHEGDLIYDGDLQGIIDRFAPYREINLKLRQPIEENILSQFGEVKSFTGTVVRLLVQRSALTASVSKMMTELEVDDLTISDPPIEEVIGQIFVRGKSE